MTAPFMNAGKHIFPQFIRDDIVWEILIRLPVASLVKFKSVSKAWYAIISDPIFVRAHLQCAKSKQYRNPPTFLISPMVLHPGPPKLFSQDIRVYQWRLDGNDTNKSQAELIYGRSAATSGFKHMRGLRHCDGLLLLQTNAKAYVFNPTTRDGIILPASKRSKIQFHGCLPIGFGLDASTGKYKVARFFHRSLVEGVFEMGMEVFTINGKESLWRETVVDPPFPILDQHVATHVNGYLFFVLDKYNQKHPAEGYLRFCLKDETFGVTPLPPNFYSRAEDENICITDLNGDLCVSFICKVQQQLMIYMTEDIICPKWYCRCKINIQQLCLPVCLLDNREIILRGGNCVFRCNSETGRVEEELDLDDIRYYGPWEEIFGHAWDDVYSFTLISYVESLVLTLESLVPVSTSVLPGAKEVDATTTLETGGKQRKSTRARRTNARVSGPEWA